MASEISSVRGLDHVLVAMPRDGEERARAFYGDVLGMQEMPKPEALAARSGLWYRCGSQMLHLGVEADFSPAHKAHPALLISDLAALRERLQALGSSIVDDELLPGFDRFYTEDPFGNRLECLWPQVRQAESAEATKALIREQFGANAASYVTSVTHASGPDLQLLVDWAQPTTDDYALDVSTGGGHTALALAPFVGRVIASDLTPRMLATARDFLTSQGVTNADYVVADAENLPFLDETFSLVAVRVAPHHYTDVQKAVLEMARVLQSGGRLVVVDTISPEDAELDATLDDWERRRDPGHVRNYTLTEWLGFLGRAGLRVTDSEVMRRPHDFQPWVVRIGMPPDAAAELERDILNAPEKTREYFKVETQDGRVTNFAADFAVLRAVK